MNLHPSHLRRYKDVAMLLLRHGNPELAEKDGVMSPDDIEESKSRSGPESLAADLEQLGPTFVKIGQLLSTRGDLVSPAYMEALSRLQDDVEPISYEEIEKVVSHQLGVRISKAFESFDTKPHGAASLGQVHRATLRGGREVAVKVQRPGIRRQIVEDLESLAEIAEFLEKHTEFGERYEVGRILDEFRGSLMRELDYQREAEHLKELAGILEEFPRLVVPGVIDDYSGPMVLTMDYLAGTKITALSGAVLADVDGDSLADEIFRGYLKQILDAGFFHADPHPGNLLLTPDHRIAVLDLGMVGRLNANLRDNLIHLLAGISHGDGQQTADAAIRIGEPRGEGLDRKMFTNRIEELVGQFKGAKLERLQMGSAVLSIMRICADSGLRIPAEINMLGKTLLNLDRVGIALSPEFDPAAAIRRNLEKVSASRVSDTLSVANLMGKFIEAKDFVAELPRRMNEILELVSTNKLRVKVDSIDERNLMLGLQKIANRITVGLILAALIVGSSMLARVETTFKIWGYPGLAFVFFMMAAVGATLLMIQIFFKDE